MPAKRLEYSTTAKAFHWVIVGLIEVQLPLGWLMPDIRRGTPPGSAMSLHISIGITILVLIVLRFLWRFTHPVAPESYLPTWQRVSSEAVHWLLYLVVLLTTLTGWFFESTRGWSISLYGALPLPGLVEEGSPIGHAIGEQHATLVWMLVTLLAIHILAALVHLLVYKDRVMHRMLPG
ncbi:MAG TPA: cytochrome b/b6 domain-containing protein [Stellaceae bacterium]|nr:cytochrome b/b6 domain-containing protein [Stellaceae bacterium]